MLAVAAVAAVVAVGAGPLSYSLASVGRSLNGNNVLAGPSEASAGGFGGGGGMRGGNGGPPSGGARAARGRASRAARRRAARSRAPAVAAAMGGGGSLSTSVIRYLEAHQGSAKYLLAATGAQTTANIIISTGKAVVTIGGFTGSDPAPTVSQFAAMVRSGQVKYVLVGGGGGAAGWAAARPRT